MLDTTVKVEQAERMLSGVYISVVRTHFVFSPNKPSMRKDSDMHDRRSMQANPSCRLLTCVLFCSVLSGQIVAMARDAAEHLSTFFIVGVVEQMEGFLEVLKMSLDPELMYPSVWTAASEVRENT